jgi:hypothetical protein
MKNLVLSISILIIAFSVDSQVTPPCGQDYGSAGDETNITSQMRYGNINDAQAAINQAKNTRGLALGCPQISYNYTPANTTSPLLSDIVNVWNTIHVPEISSFSATCPRIGRYENNSALGAYYARLAGYYDNTTILAEISNMMYDQQYSSWNISSPDPRNEGVFGYINVPSSDPCYPGGVVGSSVDALCAALPQYCVTYSSGQFSGLDFAISGQDDDNSWFDGGLAYDHAWVGVQLIESAIHQNDPILKEKYRNSIEDAVQYCISEHCVKNHNYTAKLIWLLSQAYAWTGDITYANELNYKLNKNLIPGILWDETNDGIVDGTTPPINFSNLTTVAQEPGRMWDGHNSLPWYHAMNAWALTDAYVAFRDQGDLVRAAELKPYALAMIDNLSNEIINQGVISPDHLGVRDITYALLTSIWKISDFENESHPNWESAAWAMWNSGYFNTYSTHSVCVGLYLVVKSNTAYVPLHLRENFILSEDNQTQIVPLTIYPNPGSNVITVDVFQKEAINNYLIINTSGKTVLEGRLESNKINISTLKTGTYTLFVNNVVVGRVMKI